MSDREKLLDAIRSVTGIIIDDQCCGSCSVSVVPDYAKTFVYFHSQDQERGFNRGGKGDTLVGRMHLGFGTTAAFGRRLVRALNIHGFQTDWNGTIDQRIELIGVTTTRALA